MNPALLISSFDTELAKNAEINKFKSFLQLYSSNLYNLEESLHKFPYNQLSFDLDPINLEVLSFYTISLSLFMILILPGDTIRTRQSATFGQDRQQDVQQDCDCVCCSLIRDRFSSPRRRKEVLLGIAALRRRFVIKLSQFLV